MEAVPSKILRYVKTSMPVLSSSYTKTLKEAKSKKKAIKEKQARLEVLFAQKEELGKSFSALSICKDQWQELKNPSDSVYKKKATFVVVGTKRRGM